MRRVTRIQKESRSGQGYLSHENCESPPPRNYAKQFRALHRNRLPVGPNTGPELPGSGAGLIGLQERVTLAGGTLVHGPDGAGDFVVHAELPW